MKTNTALLIFARTASEESKYKSFQASEAFFEYQNKQLLRLAKTSGLDFFWIDEQAQVGNNFEQRYLNAIQWVFDKDYKQLISIGNDSPELSLTHLHYAIESLKHNDMCFGPSKDGGFYLWGVTKKAFDKKSFLYFSWKTKSLLSEILEHLKENSITFSCLESLADLDHRKDAFHFVHSKKISLQLSIIIAIMTKDEFTSFLVDLLHQKPIYLKNYYNKGSPYAA